MSRTCPTIIQDTHRILSMRICIIVHTQLLLTTYKTYRKFPELELDVIARAYFCGICPPEPDQQLSVRCQSNGTIRQRERKKRHMRQINQVSSNQRKQARAKYSVGS